MGFEVYYKKESRRIMKVEVFFSDGERVILDNLPSDSKFLKELYDGDCFDTIKIIEHIKEGKLKKTHFLNMQQVLFVTTTPDYAEKMVFVKEEEAYENSHNNDNSTGFFDRVLSFFSRR